MSGTCRTVVSSVSVCPTSTATSCRPSSSKDDPSSGSATGLSSGIWPGNLGCQNVWSTSGADHLPIRSMTADRDDRRHEDLIGQRRLTHHYVLLHCVLLADRD